MRLSRKLYFGFAVVIVLTIIQGVVSGTVMMRLRQKIRVLNNEYTPEVILANNVRYEISVVGYHMRAFFTSLNENDYNAGDKHIAEVEKNFRELQDLNTVQTSLPRLGAYVDKLAPNIATYIELCREIGKQAAITAQARRNVAQLFDATKRNAASLQKNFDDDFARENQAYLAKLERATADQLLRRQSRMLELGDLVGQTTDLIREFWSVLLRGENAKIADIAGRLGKLTETAERILRETRQQKNLQPATILFESLKNLDREVRTIGSVAEEMAAMGARRLVAYNSVLEQAGELADFGADGIRRAVDESVDGVDKGVVLVAACIALVVLLGAGASILIVRSISRAVETVTAQLDETGGKLEGEAPSP